MKEFRVRIHRRPEHSPSAAAWSSGGNTYAAIPIAPDSLTAPLPLTFEAAAAALEALPEFYFEPDGSFLLVGRSAEGPWELCGTLIDRGPWLDHLEVIGRSPAAVFAKLLAALGVDAELLVIGLVQEAVFLAPEEFLRYLEEPG